MILVQNPFQQNPRVSHYNHSYQIPIELQMDPMPEQKSNKKVSYIFICIDIFIPREIFSGSIDYEKQK